MIVAIISTEDRSYYVDELEKLTGRPRHHWAQFGLTYLAGRLRRELYHSQNGRRELSHGHTQRAFVPRKRSKL